MRTILLRAGLAGLFIGGFTLIGWSVSAETNRVKFPDNLNELVHYTGRQRGNSVTHIKTTQGVIDLVKAGKPVPDGTQFVLIDHRDDELYRYFVMEKGAKWGADYDESRRTGDWQFQWFWADGSVNMDENTQRCQSCHESASGDDFLFTLDEIQSFNGTPVN